MNLNVVQISLKRWKRKGYVMDARFERFSRFVGKSWSQNSGVLLFEGNVGWERLLRRGKWNLFDIRAPVWWREVCFVQRLLGVDCREI